MVAEVKLKDKIKQFERRQSTPVFPKAYKASSGGAAAVAGSSSSQVGEWVTAANRC